MKIIKINKKIGDLKSMKKLLSVLLILAVVLTMTACESDGNSADRQRLIEVGNQLAENQPAPTDLNYSLERYNLIRRAYWVNGQREKAISLPCSITKPLGYIILITDNGAILGRFIVDGKVTSLNSYLIPLSEYYEGSGDSRGNEWMPDVDGTYGDNVSGIFFFTTDGKYIEWTGDFLYSDIPFEITDPVLKVENN